MTNLTCGVAARANSTKHPSYSHVLCAAVMLGVRLQLRSISPRIVLGLYSVCKLANSRPCRDRAMSAVHGHASSSEPKPLNNLFTGLPTTIFTVMTNLAIKHQTINLGQGFPDEEGPEQMKKLVGAATMEHHNQYPPMYGVPELRQAVARHSRTYCGIDVQWDSETLVTVGATEAIAASFLGILNEGDEVCARGVYACRLCRQDEHALPNMLQMCYNHAAGDHV